MKTNKLIGWDGNVIIFFAIFIILVVLFKLGQSRAELQGRLIKPFPKDTVIDCGWCRAVKAYSLNVNVHHYGDSVE